MPMTSSALRSVRSPTSWLAPDAQRAQVMRQHIGAAVELGVAELLATHRGEQP